MTGQCALIEVSKKYGPQWALRSVTVSATGGEIVGLVGPNGAGKTTLLRLASRLTQPYSGRIDVTSDSFGMLRYFGGERTLPPDVRVHQWRHLWGLDPDRRAGRKRIGALSRGMRQRLGLETIFVRPQSAAVVLLDEPWEGLDPDASVWFSQQLAMVRSFGAAAIVSSHRIHDLASVCDRCVFMHLGRVTGDVDVGGTFPANRPALLLAAFEQSKRVGES
jgi:ABC-2 type transport system ATP-binding protein